MTFIGHDIVSLMDEANRKSFSNPRYVQKILSRKEHSMLEEYPPADYWTYLLWTCKESAYKIAVKTGYRKCFAPQCFEVSLFDDNFISSGNTATGTVAFKNKIFFFRSEINSGYVSTIACTSNTYLNEINSSVDRASYDEQSSSARESLKHELASKMNIDESYINFYKQRCGIPFVEIKNLSILPDISFSHDGEYFSYAYLIKYKS
jgi:hypothetical protein